MDKDELVKSIDSLIVDDIPLDATLDLIKAKQSEMIHKSREIAKKLSIRRKELSDLETLKDLAERHYFDTLVESNQSKVARERLSPTQLAKKVEFFVDKDAERQTIDIYSRIREMANKVSTLEFIWKCNDSIASRVENMLNAQINIEKRAGKFKE